MNDFFITGNVMSSGISVPRVTSELNVRDYFGAIMVRWGINRDNYKVTPRFICNWITRLVYQMSSSQRITNYHLILSAEKPSGNKWLDTRAGYKRD